MARFNHDLLRTARLELGLGQEELARAVKVDVRTYRRYESGAVNEGGSFEVRNASRRKLLARLCKELGVADVEAWLVPETPKRAAAHTLQRAPHFVGRDEEIARIERWLTAKPGGVLLVLGVGGAGKTALAERIVREHAPKAWVHSFYDDPRSEAVIEELGRDRGPLVVLDGIETMQSEGGNGRAFGELEDPTLRQALRAIASHVSERRVVITSRLPLSDLVAWRGTGLETIELGPLDSTSSTKLFRAWGLEGTAAAFAPLHRRTGGHALSVAMLGSYVVTFLDGDPKRALDLPEKVEEDDPIARRLATVLDSYGRALREDERNVLAHLALFASAADVPLLAELTATSETAVLWILGRLARLGLVARTKQGASAHPFVREHFKRLLGERAPSARLAIRDALARGLVGKPSISVRDPVLLDRYEALFGHTLEVGRADEAFGIYTHALGGFANLGLRLGAMTRGERVLSSFAQTGAPEDVPSELGGERRSQIIYDWALYAGALGDLALAARCHDEHLRSLGPSARAARAMGFRTRAYVAWLAGEIDLARGFVERSLTFAGEIGDTIATSFHLVRGLALEAIIEHDAGDLDRATRLLDDAHAIEPVPTARRALWEAEIRLARGDAELARDLASRALADCARRGWVGHVAHAETVLGHVHLDDDLARAEEHLARALPWVDAAHEVEMELRCLHLAARIAARRGDEEALSTTLERGRSLVETHGFGSFARRFARAVYSKANR